MTQCHVKPWRANHLCSSGATETYESLKNQEKTYCEAENGHLEVMKEAYGQTKCFLMEY